jgi:N-acetylneuraminate synthase
MMNRENLAKSLVAAVDIPPETVITADMIAIQSPGQGLQPNRKKELLGRSLPQPKMAGEYFYPSDLGEGGVEPREYSFSRPWGLPVRYHDLHQIRQMSNMDFVEIHLSYKDMELDFESYLSEPLDLGLIIHAPELFAGDHTLDFCTKDSAYRRRSLSEMQRVIDLTRALTPYFTRTECPGIVTNVGGFSDSGHVPEAMRQEFYQVLEESLRSLDTQDVEILPQTMPPFPWHFGGQQFHNILVDAESIARFCESTAMRVCLDISHSKLACNHQNVSFSSFLKQVLPHTAHLHLADAAGVDGEGLQIGEGDIDWRMFFQLLTKYSASATFIPEIWQGHKNDNEGAWIALERLEKAAKGAAEDSALDQREPGARPTAKVVAAGSAQQKSL